MSYDSFFRGNFIHLEKMLEVMAYLHTVISHTDTVYLLKVFSYVIPIFPAKFEYSSDMEFCVSDGLTKIHNAGQICTQNRKADNDGGCLL